MTQEDQTRAIKWLKGRLAKLEDRLGEVERVAHEPVDLLKVFKAGMTYAAEIITSKPITSTQRAANDLLTARDNQKELPKP